MKLEVRGDKSLLGEAERLKLELRLGLVLGRFGDDIEGVTLNVSETPSASKRCQIVVALRPRQVRVESSDPDLAIALERASERAVRAIDRALKRAREAEDLTR